MIKRDTEIEVGMWNENFISWGAEDCEFYFRLNSFGRKVGRVLVTSITLNMVEHSTHTTIIPSSWITTIYGKILERGMPINLLSTIKNKITTQRG